MNSRLVGLVGATVALFAGSLAHASAQRTFVASNGNDALACSITQPCRSFGAAVAKTNSGGEVIVLDSAGYGPVNITQAVSIIAPEGIYAGVSVFSGDGITINAAGLTVRLVGLTVNQQASGVTGIDIVAAVEVSIERSRITGFRGDNSRSGVVVGQSVQLLVRDSFIADNYIGIRIGSGAGVPEVAVHNTVFQNNDSGGITIYAPSRLSVHNAHFSASKPPLELGYPQGISIDVFSAGGPVEVHVSDSAFDGVDRAVDASKGVATYVSVSIVRSEISHTILGLIASDGASMAIEDTRFVHNDTAILINSGSDLYTAGNNYMAYCGAYITGPGTLHSPGGLQ